MNETPWFVNAGLTIHEIVIGIHEGRIDAEGAAWTMYVQRPWLPTSVPRVLDQEVAGSHDRAEAEGWMYFLEIEVTAEVLEMLGPAGVTGSDEFRTKQIMYYAENDAFSPDL